VRGMYEMRQPAAGVRRAARRFVWMPATRYTGSWARGQRTATRPALDGVGGEVFLVPAPQSGRRIWTPNFRHATFIHES